MLLVHAPRISTRPTPRFGNRKDDPERLERFFLTFGPDSPFKRDADWARQMNTLTYEAMLSLALEGSTEVLLDRIGQKYSLTRGEEFGRLRRGWDAVPIQSRLYLQDYRLRSQQLAQAELTRRGLQLDQLPIEDRDNNKFGPMPFTRLFTHSANLDGVPTPLVSIIRQCHGTTPKGDGPIPWDKQVLWWSMEAPSPAILKRFYRHGDQLIAQLRTLKAQPHTEANLEHAFETIGEFHWLLTQLMPYERGTAGIADVIAKSMSDWLGIATTRWTPGKAPDLEAFVTPLAQYRKSYITLFAQRPTWLS